MIGYEASLEKKKTLLGGRVCGWPNGNRQRTQPLLEGVARLLSGRSPGFQQGQSDCLPTKIRSGNHPKDAEYSGGTAPDFDRFPYYLYTCRAPETRLVQLTS